MTHLTTEELDKLEALAKAATPGPWMRLFGERTVYDRMSDGCRGNAIVRADHPSGQQDAANLDFIAAANPSAILNLIAQARATLPTAAVPAGLTIDTPEFRQLLEKHRHCARWAESAVAEEIIATVDAQLAAKGSSPATQQGDLCRTDGRCQYAIDHGAEGLGHCPTGKCCMPLAATQQAEPVSTGMQAAAEFIEKRAEQYLQDHADTDGDTGSTVFHYGEAGRDYHSALIELAEDLRASPQAAVSPWFDSAMDTGIIPDGAAVEQQDQASDERAAVASYKPGTWFDARTLDEMQAFYLSRLPAIREAAQAHGYAIGLHGSTRRDFDLMAMQWREDASDKDSLARAIADAACGIRREGAYEWEQKPSGRFAVSIPICWTAHDNPDFDKPSVGHIDLSLIESFSAPAPKASGATEEDILQAAQKRVWAALDRKACPGVWMQLASDAIFGFKIDSYGNNLASPAATEATKQPTWGAVHTVGDMVRNLLTLDQAAPIFTAFHVTISRERVIDGKWIDSSRKDVPYTNIIWAKPDERADADIPTIDTPAFNELLDEFAYRASERRALGGDFGSAEAEDKAASTLVAYIDSFRAPVFGTPTVVPNCGGDGIANTSCSTPKHQTVKSGATYIDWNCANCGGSGRTTWD